MRENLTDEEWADIEGAIFARRKLHAIKHVREYTGAGLKEAKDFVEDHARYLLEAQPEKFETGGEKAGCSTQVLLLTLVLALLVAGSVA